MIKIDGNAFLAGAAVSYIASVITFQALLSTTLDNNPYLAAASTALFSAAVPAVAYCAGRAIAKAGVAAEVILFAIIHLLLLFTFLHVRDLGFWASVTLSAVAAVGVFLGKLAGGQLDVMNKMVIGYFAKASCNAVGSDPASAECFLVVVALASALYLAEVTGPEPGTPHAVVARVLSSPPGAGRRRGYLSPRWEAVVLLGCLCLGLYLYLWCFMWISRRY